MDNSLARPDDKDNIFSENPRAKFLHKVNTKKWDILEREAEHDQDLQDEQHEQETDLVPDDPQASMSLQFLERNISELSHESTFLKLTHWSIRMGLQVKELGADHIDWVEKTNNIIQNINSTESTVRSLLNEVISLEDQTENLEDRDLDPDQGASIEEKIMGIRNQLREMNNKLAQVDACNEAHRLKERLIDRIQNFYKEMTLLNTNLGMYHLQERTTDLCSSEDMDIEETGPLLPEASPPPSGQSTPPCTAVWKHALKIFTTFHFLIITGLACYILFVGVTFIFERELSSTLGCRTVWELRGIIAPFLDLEDLLPS
ncbi:single-pass membrane and coiled-coil domain-containing protein 2 [Castor canadensis]|uniref:Single-pass membrane and coiled-coil domain-containing protein 2 n=1 Tax=Castor canadensis TaxID=51338 RepID=A0AC58NH20_CASCN